MQQTLGWILVGIGAILLGAGYVWLVVLAFGSSRRWGVACLVFPPSATCFALKNWQTAKTPFLMVIASIPFLLLGPIVMGPAPMG